MSAPPYMKLYWGDYHRGTRHLRRPAEHGAYLLLIGALWDAGGKLPADDATLAKHALCSLKEWAAMRETLMPFFKIVRGQLTHKRVTAELAKYGDTVRKRKAAGKSGGEARHRKDSEIRQANAKQKPTKPEPELEPKEDRSSDDDLLFELAPERAILKGKAAFEAFWKAYPRKVGKAEADKALAKALKLIGGVDPLAVILAGLERVTPSWSDPKYTPHPATWLNRHGWQDEPTAIVVALPLAAQQAPRTTLADQIGEQNRVARERAFQIMDRGNG